MSDLSAKFAFRHRGLLVGLPLIASMFIRWHESEKEPLIWIVGGILFFLGLFIRIWSQQHLHYRLKVKKNLTTTGPYAIMRNPIYVGNTLITVGLTVASELLWMAPISLLVCFIVFPFVVRDEETYLKELYGDDFAAYCSSVPRWFPRWPRDGKVQLNTEFLRASIRTELYNFFYIVPFVLKEVLLRH